MNEPGQETGMHLPRIRADDRGYWRSRRLRHNSRLHNELLVVGIGGVNFASELHATRHFPSRALMNNPDLELRMRHLGKPGFTIDLRPLNHEECATRISTMAFS